MAYIVELWNQDGLFAGPGQVYAGNPRKAAVTVMRNIGRTQLSAGGSPLVVHVQHLETGQEHHYGWPSALQGGAVAKGKFALDELRASEFKDVDVEDWKAVEKKVEGIHNFARIKKPTVQKAVNAILKEGEIVRLTNLPNKSKHYKLRMKR